MRAEIGRRAVLAGLAAAAPCAAWADAQVGAVTFEGIFGEPLLDAAALAGATGARVRMSMRIKNGTTAPLQLAAHGAVLPELLDGQGQVVAPGRSPLAPTTGRPNESLSLAPGGTLLIPAFGVLKLDGVTLTWRSADGTASRWRAPAAGGPYRLRLRYRAVGGGDLWPGTGVTQDVALPQKP